MIQEQDLPQNMEPPSASLRERALKEVRSRYDVTLFFLIPAVDPRRQFLVSNGFKVGLTEKEINELTELFTQAGFWVPKGTQISAHFDLMDVGELSVPEYLEATLGVISRLSTEGPCIYETTTLATSKDLAKEFVQGVNKCFKQFYEKSAESDKSVLFSWVHAGLIAHENRSKTQTLL